MKPKSLTLPTARFIVLTILLITGLSLQGFSQTPDHATDRIVCLTNGDTLYSHQLKVIATDTAEKYLLLDNAQQVPIHLVSRFRGLHGTYLALPGSAGTDLYKVVQEGRRISEYSRTLYEAPVDSTGAHPVAYYFRKPGEQQMHLLTYQSILNAMADNPAAQHQVRLVKTQVYGGLAITLVSAAIMTIGFHETFKKATSQPLTTPTLPPFNGVLPPLPPTPKTSLSPLVLIGAGGMVAGLVVTFGAHKHEVKALSLYNQPAL